MPAIQFCGTDNVVNAFDLQKNVTQWAVFYGKEPLYAGSTGEELRSYLSMLSKGGTAAVYTLRMYNVDCDPDEIDRGTPYHRSLSFKLSSGLYEQHQVAGSGPFSGDPIMAGVQNHLYDKVAKAVKAEIDGENEDEGEETVGDLLKGLLRDPEKLAGVLEKIPNVLHAVRGFMNRSAVGMPVSLAGTQPMRAGTTAAPAQKEQPSDADLVRLQKALDILGDNDPEIIPHLEKLAQIARDSPQVYKMAIAQLNSF